MTIKSTKEKYALNGMSIRIIIQPEIQKRKQFRTKRKEKEKNLRPNDHWLLQWGY